MSRTRGGGSWGRGWEVSIRKALSEHERTLQRAAEILAGECGERHPLGSRADLCPKCHSYAEGKSVMSDSTMRTTRGYVDPKEGNRAKTLRGLGALRNTLQGLGAALPGSGAEAVAGASDCPCCQLTQGVPSAVAAILGVALAEARGADAIKRSLCEVHRRLYRLVLDEIKHGPKTTGAGDTWDD